MSKRSIMTTGEFPPHTKFGTIKYYKHRGQLFKQQIVKLQKENERLAEAAVEKPPYKEDLITVLKSIAANSCCEAAKVAQSVLTDGLTRKERER